jgi:16S rRNA processing protein RimM
VWPLTDRPDSTFASGVELRVGDGDATAPDPLFPPLRITEGRPYRRGFLLRFEGIHDRDRADLLAERYLLRPFEEIEPPEADEILYHQLLGMTVVTRQGETVGEVREVFSLRPADLLEVSRGRDTVLIPFTKEIVVEWDVERGRLVVDPPEGLLDI